MAGGHQTPGSSVSLRDVLRLNHSIQHELRAGRDALNREHEHWHDAHPQETLERARLHQEFHRERDRKFGELNDHINELRRSLYHPDATPPTMPPPVQSPPSPPGVRPPPDLDRPPIDRPPLRRLD